MDALIKALPLPTLPPSSGDSLCSTLPSAMAQPPSRNMIEAAATIHPP